MKQIVCEMCGGKDLIKRDSVYICQNCGTKYSVEEAKKMMVEVDTKPKKSRDFSFLTKPLWRTDDIGCGCLPVGCFSFTATPIFIIGLVVLMIIGAIAPKNSSTSASNSTSTSNIEDQKIEARVQLAQAIKANLRDPKSYQNTEIDVYTVEEYIFVKNTFRGKNRYGGYEICTFVARFNFNTKPAEWAITNNPKSDSGCREIMIALP
ncbi:MAG: hypothetical protein FWF70_00375 [Bacteroidetes bacterium]|nr:hypothetical protein [Bacteroidota bacterium]